MQVMRNKLILATLLIGMICGCTQRKEVTLEAEILSHHVLADKRGNAKYYTIVRTSDGFIEEKKGLEYYYLPVGFKLEVKTMRP